MTSLYDRLGGKDAVDAMVAVFYRRVIVDPRISHFFDGIDMAEQVNKQRAFLNMVLGGENIYTGRDMRRSHERLVRNGLNDDHFDAVIGQLAQVLSQFSADPQDIDEVLAICNSVRDDVLNR